MSGHSVDYQEQRAVFAEKRRLYTALASIYHATGELYRVLRTMYWKQRHFAAWSNPAPLQDEQAIQAQRRAILRQLAALSLQAHSLSAEIAELRRKKHPWMDRS